MDCILDNIIFSLQRGGGASVVWSEHISRLLEEQGINCSFVEYDNASNNIFRRNLDIPSNLIKVLSSRFLSIRRYINLNNNGKRKYIFHSSHYRIDTNPNALNITTVHDFTYERFVSGVRRKVHSWQKWNAIRKSDAVICISESTKKDLLYYLPDVDENKIHVVYNGVSDLYKPIKPSTYELNIPFLEYILYVGTRHVPYKNFATVVKCCESLKIPLIMIGGEPITEDERVMLDNALGKENYLHVQGASIVELNEYYNRALALLYLSLYEGFGIPVIEAQKAGCPVVALASSSIPEVMGDSEMLIKEVDSIEQIINAICILKDSDRIRQNEISKGLINSQRFSWDNTYKGTISVYRNLL